MRDSLKRLSLRCPCCSSQSSTESTSSTDLPATSEGMPASYQVNGRQFIVLPVAAGTGQFAARFGGPPAGRGGPPAGRGAAAPPAGAQPPAAPPQAPELQGQARQGGAGGRAGGGRGAAVAALPGQYMVFALPQR